MRRAFGQRHAFQVSASVEGIVADRDLSGDRHVLERGGNGAAVFRIVCRAEEITELRGCLSGVCVVLFSDEGYDEAFQPRAAREDGIACIGHRLRHGNGGKAAAIFQRAVIEPRNGQPVHMARDLHFALRHRARARQRVRLAVFFEGVFQPLGRAVRFPAMDAHVVRVVDVRVGNCRQHDVRRRQFVQPFRVGIVLAAVRAVPAGDVPVLRAGGRLVGQLAAAAVRARQVFPALRPARGRLPLLRRVPCYPLLRPALRPARVPCCPPLRRAAAAPVPCRRFLLPVPRRARTPRRRAQARPPAAGRRQTLFFITISFYFYVVLLYHAREKNATARRSRPPQK